MRERSEEAAERKVPIRLQVLKVNSRAVAFYQRLGFNSTGESGTHILMERRSGSLPEDSGPRVGKAMK